MHAKDRPKQFLFVHGKPIIVHTVEIFNHHPEIDGIVVVCIEEWIPYMEKLKYTYRLDKVASIVPGGATGQMSIYNGLVEAARIYGREGHAVLIHDGVRPLIDADLISANIRSVEQNGTSVSCGPAKETVVLVNDAGEVEEVVNRRRSKIAKAPQGFRLDEVLDVQEKAISEGAFFDLMYVNGHLQRQYAFLRHAGKDLLLVVVNFEDQDVDVDVCLPAHAFDYLQLKETTVTATDLLSKEKESMILRKDGRVRMMIGARSGRVWKLKA